MQVRERQANIEQCTLHRDVKIPESMKLCQATAEEEAGAVRQLDSDRRDHRRVLARVGVVADWVSMYRSGRR